MFTLYIISCIITFFMCFGMINGDFMEFVGTEHFKYGTNWRRQVASACLFSLVLCTLSIFGLFVCFLMSGFAAGGFVYTLPNDDI